MHQLGDKSVIKRGEVVVMAIIFEGAFLEKTSSVYYYYYVIYVSVMTL
jgi:hypothetical protein